MIDVIPARPFMAERMELQQAQVLAGQMMTPAAIESAIRGGTALAAVDGDRIICMAGIYEVWEGRAIAWGLLCPSIGASMTTLHRITKRGLDVSLHRRVEADVLDDHVEGHRWMRLLGFTKEGVRRAYWQGRDYALYARVR